MWPKSRSKIALMKFLNGPHAAAALSTLFCLAAQAGDLARDLKLSIFEKGFSTNLLLSLEASHVGSDYLRKGFFKIGILPVLVCEDLTLKIHSPEALMRAEAELRAFHGCWTQVQVRKLSIVDRIGQSLLMAKAATLRDGIWELRAVRLTLAKEPQSVEHAILHVGVGKTGDVYNLKGQGLCNIFSLETRLKGAKL